ncbi:MAG: carbohydrate binding family 9 domain-containing protein [Gammaproteobacteria bacterium]|nr:carbohydrate binding family 9 domain-containing protein [Gammaproteobacteria bacterium]
MRTPGLLCLLPGQLLRAVRSFCMALTLSLLPLLWSTGGIAQDTVDANADKSVRVVRVDAAPLIDGKLDDAAWAQAEVLTDFHQTRPRSGAEPSDPTEVYLVYDDDALYIGARMYDSEPQRIAAPTVRHGQGLGRDDRIVIILDPFHTGRGAYRFETNANGIRHDALYDSVSSFESEWTVIWESAADYFDGGWEAEMAIPFKTLSFDPGKDTWGFNFGRGIRRRGEEIAWVSRNRSYNASILGSATGLRGMDQGMGLDVVPSLTINQQRTFVPYASNDSFEPSLDVFYKLTPSLNASLTLNTDFSAAEVDDRQVNLSRFSLFFPEKRDFFLNDSDLFAFGRIGDISNEASSRSNDNNGRPFFSRRLGLSSSGQPVDLNYGAKLSGRIGRMSVGMLAIRQDAFESVDASNVLVARVAANVLKESSMGMIITAGDPNANTDNQLAGVDFRYLNTRFAGDSVLEADAWYQQSDTDGRHGDDAAFGFGIAMPNNAGWRGGLHYKQIQANFNPALGFVNRSAIEDTTAEIGYTSFPGSRLVQEIFSGIDVQRTEFIDGGLDSAVILGRLVELETNSRDAFKLHYSRTREIIATPFEIYEDNERQVIVPPGTYSFGEAAAIVETGGQRDLSADLTFLRGEFYDGSRTNLAGAVTWRQSRRFTVSASYDWNDIKLPQGDFITRLTSLTTEVNFSPTLYWVNLIQYDNVSEVLGVNARLVWIPTAGQEGLIVVNHGLQDRDRDNSFKSELSDINIKLSYTFRF